MPFVKLDCGILNSTLWFDRLCRDVFITALLMAEPREFTEPIPQIAVDSLEGTGWCAPAGWYGFVPAAGVGILHRAGVEEGEDGRAALRRLGEPEAESRSKDFEGRRLIRVNGGYLVLNFMTYRDRDYTTAERSRRYRARRASRRVETQSRRDITQAEAEAEAEAEAKTHSHTAPVAPRGVRGGMTEAPDRELGARAARFLETYEALYATHRHGAKLLRRRRLDWDEAVTLCRTWDDARLTKLAEVFLTSDDEWIAKTDRGFAVFCARATWCDERLSAWEASQRTKAAR